MEWTSKISVELIDKMGNDENITRAAWASTGAVPTHDNSCPGDNGCNCAVRGKKKGLINYLAKMEHGTPFEMAQLQFRVHAPIFVWREHHRHRIGWSYNEESARYKQLAPVFWVPNRDRLMVPVPRPTVCPKCSSTELDYIQQGTSQCRACKVMMDYHTSARPLFSKATDDMYSFTVSNIQLANQIVYKKYVEMLDLGIAKEVARAVLPVNIYSTCITNCNLRSLMHFLHLRTPDTGSRPQAEIVEVARQYEQCLRDYFPWAYSAFVECGRRAP